MSTSSNRDQYTRTAYSDSRITLPLSRRTFLVHSIQSTDHSSSQTFQSAYSLVCDAARRADNVAEDEYPTLGHFKDLVDRSNITLSLSTPADSDVDDPTSSTKCLIVVSPCKYARSINPTLCTITIITAEEFSKQQYFRELVAVAVDVAISFPEAYSACVIDVFVICLEQFMAIREEGFLVTACIPNAGKLVGVSGYSANYIMYKEFIRANTNSSAYSCVSYKPAAVDAAKGVSTEFQPTLLPSYYKLPVQHKLRDGTIINIRSMRHDDVLSFYEAIRTAVENGEGYGLDEIPNFDYFVRYYVHNFRNLVIELADRSGTVVGYANSGPSPFSRSLLNPVVTDANLIFTANFRGKGFLSTLVILFSKMDEDLEDDILITGHQGDAAMTRLSSAIGSFKGGYIPNGVLPKGIYFKDKGWVDLLLYYRQARKRMSKL